MQTELLPIHTIPVGEAERLDFLPRHWPRAFMQVENACFNAARLMIPSYTGGYWEYVEVSNGAAYLWPRLQPDQADGKICVQCDGNGYRGWLTPEAAGIVVVLMALSHLSFKYRDDATIAEQFHLLRDYAGEHAEAAEIFHAID